MAALIPEKAGFHLAAIPRLYALRTLRSIVVQVLLILLLIEAIFLAEKINHVLQSAIDLRAHASDIFWLLVFTAPEVSALALPMAILIAVYRVALRCREDRELLVLAGMGVGAHQFIFLATGVGLIGIVLSVVVSGDVEPRAQFGQRSIMFAAQYKALRGGITPGQFYPFGAYTVFAGPQKEETRERRLFIHRRSGDAERVMVAARARLEGPSSDGKMTLYLNELSAQEIRVRRRAEPNAGELAAAAADSCSGCAGFGMDPFISLPIASMRIGKFAQELKVDELLRFEPRGRSPAEWTSAELWGLASPPAAPTKAHLSESGRRFGRSLLCLVAPLLAGLALALTTRVTQAFALPAACAALMCLDLAGSALAPALAGYGQFAVLIALAAAALALIVVLVWQVVGRQHALVKPALSRA